MQNVSENIIDTMFQLSRLMRGSLNFNSDLTCLSHVQVFVLMLLKTKDGVSMTEIAQDLKIELPSATSLVNKLAAQKLVTRTADPNDRRLVIIHLSEKGQTMLEEAKKEKQKKITDLLSTLSSTEQTQLLTIMYKIKKHLEVTHAK